MRKALLLLLCCGLLAACEPDIPKDTVKTTNLPLKSNVWRELEVIDNSNAETRVLELEHGWLVYRRDNFSGGMAFVPKPAPRSRY